MNFLRAFLVVVFLLAAASPSAAQVANSVEFGSDLHPNGDGPWILRTLDNKSVLGVLFEREGAEARPTEGKDVVMLLANGADSHSLRARIALITDAKAPELAWMGLPLLRLVRGHSGRLQTSAATDFVSFYCFWTFAVIEEPPCTGTVRVRVHVPGGRGLILTGWISTPFTDEGIAACRSSRLPRPKLQPINCPSPIKLPTRLPGHGEPEAN